MSDIDNTFDSAKARGFKLQTLMQFGETSWMACFIPLNPKGSDAFYYGRGDTAAVALAEALARHDTPTIALKADRRTTCSRGCDGQGLVLLQ